MKGRGGIEIQICLAPVSAAWLLALVEKEAEEGNRTTGWGTAGRVAAGLAVPAGFLPTIPTDGWRKPDAW